jgi:hypothetical protein
MGQQNRFESDEDQGEESGARSEPSLRYPEGEHAQGGKEEEHRRPGGGEDGVR